MKRVNFTAIVMAIAICLVMASCGGGNAKKSDADKIAEDAVKGLDIKEKASATKWPDNEYTKQAVKPDIPIRISGNFEMGGVKGFSLEFENATIEQLKAYAQKLKEKGFSLNAFESDDSSMYSFSAENSAGYGVLITWAQGKAGMMISKSK
jgi:ABC-type glycerol-3-phosphate transport system substrate-binding protein